MTSCHIAPYATNVAPLYSVGEEVFCTRLGRRCTVYGVHVCQLNSGAFGVFYCFGDSSSDTDVWYPERCLIKCDPYVRDRLGYCVFVGNTVCDTSTPSSKKRNASGKRAQMTDRPC